jgi:hypothetical protein
MPRLLKLAQRKAAKLMVKHRAKNLSYKAALKNFGLTQKWRLWLHSDIDRKNFIP